MNDLDESEPLIICVEGSYIRWLVSAGAPGTPGVERRVMEADLQDQGFGELHIRRLLDHAWLHETSDENVTIDSLIAGAQAHHPEVRTPGDLLSWANGA